jgi:phosphatidylglycerophosphatase A
MSDPAKAVSFDLFKPHQFLALGFGSGLIKPAPGTWGTLAAVPLVLLMSHLPLWAYVALTVVACVVGVWICGRCADDVGVHDHPSIVWDEFAGYFVTMIWVEPTMINLAIGFALFRFFDILKPWPVSYLDRHVTGGLGIMADDILAGVFSCIILQLMIHFFLA